MSDGSEKTCVLCGESCAGQPRIKDPKGRYYHRSCHDQALRDQQQRRRSQEQSAERAFVSAEPPPVADNDDIMSMLLDDSPDAPPTSAEAASCPSCGTAVAPGAVLCVNCGFNLQSGHAVQTAVKQDRSLPTGNAGAFLASPLASGLIALGVFGILFIVALQGESGVAAFIAAYGLYGLIVGVWAIVAGFLNGILHGILTLCVPFYVLYTVYGLNENPHLKWLYGVNLLVIPAYIFLLVQYGDLASTPAFGP